LIVVQRSSPVSDLHPINGEEVEAGEDHLVIEMDIVGEVAEDMAEDMEIDHHTDCMRVSVPEQIREMTGTGVIR